MEVTFIIHVTQLSVLTITHKISGHWSQYKVLEYTEHAIKTMEVT